MKYQEIIFPGTVRRGDKGGPAKLVQEWLCLHDILVKIDADFGPVTEAGVKAFQRKHRLGQTGVVDGTTFNALIQPMNQTLRSVRVKPRSLGNYIVTYAQRHLYQHPREVGGENGGPWVRLYTGGHEGANYPWCAGFAGFIISQAADALQIALPMALSLSCDTLVTEARQKGLFLGAPADNQKAKIKPGSLFLNQKSSNNWVHTGIVVQADKDIIHTIEGNTNDEGSREGYEVCARIRGYADKDFIIFV